MTLQKTIELKVLHYPSLFCHRVAALNHLYCVIGSGYEWIDGELVDTCDSFSKKPGELTEAGKIMDDLLNDMMTLTPEQLGGMWKSRRRMWVARERQRRAVRHVQQISTPEFYRWVPRKFEFYPVCEYSPLSNLPPDIRPDWREGAKETFRLLSKYRTWSPKPTVSREMLRSVMDDLEKSSD